MKEVAKKSKKKKKKIVTSKLVNECSTSFILWETIFSLLNNSTTEEQRLFFKVDLIPPSTNALHDKKMFKNKKTGRMFLSVKNVDEVEILRIKVKSAINKSSHRFDPQGTVAVVIMIESPEWLNKDRTAKKKDLDNNLKSLLDAVEKATGVPDELNFQIMAFKVPSKVDKTRVYMYDLQDKYFSLEQ